MSTPELPLPANLPANAFALVVGAAAVGFSVLYFVSDLVELGQGGFSQAQLLLTYVG